MSNKMLLAVVLQLVLIVLNVLFFLWVDTDCGAVVWISYACATVAYIVLETAYLLPRSDKGRAWGYVIPYIATMFFVVDLIAGVLLSLFVDSVAFALTVHLIIIISFIVWGALHIGANRSISKSLERQTQDAQYVKIVAARLKAMAIMVKDENVRKEIGKLYDVVYASPIKTNAMAHEYEMKVFAGVDELEVMVAAEQWMNAAELLKRLSIIAATRNRMLAVM
ncbi:MAG: hypothetical protein J6Q98_02145 [Bacteroidaceae bacterium]|nr:hypothetical protein [Bacteroidaceae bacterium]